MIAGRSALQEYCSHLRMEGAAAPLAWAISSRCVFGPSASASITAAIIVVACFGPAPSRARCEYIVSIELDLSAVM